VQGPGKRRNFGLLTAVGRPKLEREIFLVEIVLRRRNATTRRTTCNILLSHGIHPIALTLHLQHASSVSKSHTRQGTLTERSISLPSSLQESATLSSDHAQAPRSLPISLHMQSSDARPAHPILRILAAHSNSVWMCRDALQTPLRPLPLYRAK
jgi:hypothetical protein